MLGGSGWRLHWAKARVSTLLWETFLLKRENSALGSESTTLGSRPISNVFIQAFIRVPNFRKIVWFFINFTVIFCSLRDNPVIQNYQLEHERHRAV